MKTLWSRRSQAYTKTQKLVDNNYKVRVLLLSHNVGKGHNDCLYFSFDLLDQRSNVNTFFLQHQLKTYLNINQTVNT